MVALRRDYLAPYDSLEGQLVLVLVLVGGLFLVGPWVLVRLAETRPPERLFTHGLGGDA